MAYPRHDVVTMAYPRRDVNTIAWHTHVALWLLISVIEIDLIQIQFLSVIYRQIKYVY